MYLSDIKISDIISTIALFISIFSAGAAIWSAYNSQKSRKASECIAQIAKLKQEDELSPKFEAWIEIGEGLYWLHIKNIGSVTYKYVLFNIDKVEGFTGSPIEGIAVDSDYPNSGDFGLFEAGTTKIYAISKNPIYSTNPSNLFRLHLNCIDSNNKEWETTVTGKMQPRNLDKGWV